MKRFLKKDKLLVLLALLALLVSLVPIAGRMQTEENNKYYECVLDYSSPVSYTHLTLPTT